MGVAELERIHAPFQLQQRGCQGVLDPSRPSSQLTVQTPAPHCRRASVCNIEDGLPRCQTGGKASEGSWLCHTTAYLQASNRID